MRTRASTVGNVLVGAGAIIGAATVAAVATGYEIVLTPEIIQLLIYKALGAAAVGLMLVGTWIGRGGKDERHDTTSREADQDAVLKQTDGPILGSDGLADLTIQADRTRDRVNERVEKDQDQMRDRPP